MYHHSVECFHRIQYNKRNDVKHKMPYRFYRKAYLNGTSYGNIFLTIITRLMLWLVKKKSQLFLLTNHLTVLRKCCTCRLSLSVKTLVQYIDRAISMTPRARCYRTWITPRCYKLLINNWQPPMNFKDRWPIW